MFQLFVGQKYGQAHVPVEILSTDMEKILVALRGVDEDTSLLEQWYAEDRHVAPPVYHLKHVHGRRYQYNAFVCPRNAHNL